MSEQKQHLLVRQPRGHFHRAYVRIRDAHILGLPAGKATQKMRIAEQACWRMSPQFGGNFGVRVASLAAGEEPPLTEKAIATGDREWDNDTVPDLQLAVRGADFDDLPMVSWPTTSPLCMLGMIPSVRCRSEPQIAHAVTLMMASRGCSILGFGTVSQRMSPLPCQVIAFIWAPLVAIGTRNSRWAIPFPAVFTDRFDCGC